MQRPVRRVSVFYLSQNFLWNLKLSYINGLNRFVYYEFFKLSLWNNEKLNDAREVLGNSLEHYKITEPEHLDFNPSIYFGGSFKISDC